jgi:hypothetical protein
MFFILFDKKIINANSRFITNYKEPKEHLDAKMRFDIQTTQKVECGFVIILETNRR